MKLKHPASDQRIEVRDEEAGPYLSQGWLEVESRKSEKSDKG